MKALSGGRGLPGERSDPETRGKAGLKAGPLMGTSATWRGAGEAAALAQQGLQGCGGHWVGGPGTAFLPGSPGAGTRLLWGVGGRGGRTLVLEVCSREGGQDAAAGSRESLLVL